MSERYAKAGVDVTRGYEVVHRIKKYAKNTYRPGVISDIGSFGGLFLLDIKKYLAPVLVSGTDGVGTKLLLATELSRHDTVGIDLVAMSVNDVVTSGAEPLYFLDYIATGKIDPDHIEQVIKGIHDGCLQAGCALIGGETAEMPGLYQKSHYDLAGFCVGVVEQADIITGETIQAGDIVIGLSSNGVHSNGYSLVRKILGDHPEIDLNQVDPFLEKTPKDALLMPTRIYVKPVLALTKQVKVKGMAHITGGGFFENLPRMLPSGVGISMECSQIPIPPVFLWLEKLGGLDRVEMYHVFNMGLGMALVVAQEDVKLTLSLLEEAGEKPIVAGKIIATPGVFLE